MLRWVSPPWMMIPLLALGPILACGMGTGRPPADSEYWGDDDSAGVCGGSFDTDVLPILRQQCSQCHRAGAASGNLDLTSFEGVLSVGANGPAVTCGDCTDSYLIQRMNGQATPLMPPLGYPSTDDVDIDCICLWIDLGCPDN